MREWLPELAALLAGSDAGCEVVAPLEGPGA
jgi:hypothetical protein